MNKRDVAMIVISCLNYPIFTIQKQQIDLKYDRLVILSTPKSILVVMSAGLSRKAKCPAVQVPD
ncbi:hypothetical protein [Undibacterium oligocarboniphilum]|uniref:Uncharacterized protein n=1 Tax=Undibacterium oligocarboniphilum TaxID=666702 RepID=A0A850QJK6_9BURK|nr:hypothetical protein [Undibacterium oligocarboniphilum]MBC3868624.1 hypothetical protein [Undibacterium oligocarboniphilum]NVO76604.1 hypothetical protein [Undibacterium oligocarboniphilum]